MQPFFDFIASTRNRIAAFVQALNAALTETAPLESSGFDRRDDDTVFQPRAARARAQREAGASGANARS